jgi:hypothetical protein
MRRRKAAVGCELKAAESAATPLVAELPPWKAFVVQFSRKADAPAGIFSGRVEHLSSGRRVRFKSAADLVKILETMLEGLGENAV